MPKTGVETCSRPIDIGALPTPSTAGVRQQTSRRAGSKGASASSQRLTLDSEVESQLHRQPWDAAEFHTPRCSPALAYAGPRLSPPPLQAQSLESPVLGRLQPPR